MENIKRGELSLPLLSLVESMGFEPTTFALRRRRAPDCATTPHDGYYNVKQEKGQSRISFLKLVPFSIGSTPKRSRMVCPRSAKVSRSPRNTFSFTCLP